MVSRRTFLETSAAALASPLLTGTIQAADKEPSKKPSEIHRSKIIMEPTDDLCDKFKAAGFHGAEVRKWNISVAEARKCRQIAEKHDFRLHSVMQGWSDFTPKNKSAGIAATQTALRVAAAYGADTLLLVPYRLGNMKMPEPWNFDIDFDPKTLHIKTVCEGDNAPYADYIAAHNAATDSSIRAVEALIPTAAREGVRIALENVWNNLWPSPDFFAAFCKYFNDPWVGCYFDLGNHTKYSRCEGWLKALGTNIVKLHIKGFKIDEVKGKFGGGPGKWCRVDQASIDWVAVRKLLAEIGYNGWCSVEEGGYRSEEECGQILDKILTLPN